MRTISQFDAMRYEEELDRLRQEMTGILLEMEERHSTASEEDFLRWWEEEGAMRRYFDLKGKAEKIERILWSSVIEEAEYPKMRTSGFGSGRSGGPS